MIIDNHLHAFPNQAGSAGYPDAETYAGLQQRLVPRTWGRMLSSHTDPKFIPEPDEDVGFTVGKFGRWEWRKHGEDCWVQRFPETMHQIEHPPEQMLAHMDSVGIDMGVIQAVYMEPNYGREVYIADCIKRWNDRFIGTLNLEYDLTKSDEHLFGEIRKLTRAVEELGFKGLYNPVRKGQPVDDPRCDPLWKEVVRLDIPVFIQTGYNSKEDYLTEIKRIVNVCQRYPEINVLDNCLGGNVRHPDHSEHVDNPRELFPLLELGNFYMEVGYVLAYEDWDIWGKDSEYPYPLHEQIVRIMYERFGARCMLWASDMPFTLRACTYRQCLDAIRLHADFMTADERKMVMGENAARLYKVNGSATDV